VIPETQPVRDDKTTWSDTIKQGAALYQQACSHCHGVEMRTSGSTYDLRVFPKDDQQRFIDAVTRGKGDMPAWGDKLSAQEISTLYEYVVH
jgi:alcohol dehydrogenase (cytochrome c)